MAEGFLNLDFVSSFEFCFWNFFEFGYVEQRCPGAALLIVLLVLDS